jgi:hypothetical protein
MSRMPLWSATLFAATLVLGCGEPSRLTAPGDAGAPSSAPSLKAVQSPGVAGALIIHDVQGAFFSSEFDPTPGLSFLIGWTVDELELFCATGEITLGSLKELLVTRPDGSLHVNLHGAQIPLLVWQTGSNNPCDLVDVPHLTGTGQFFASDNDFFVSGNRTESTVGAVHGQVTSEDGERFRFTQEFHAVILRTGEVQKFIFDLKLTPIGK